jgi:hypothetical protein
MLTKNQAYFFGVCAILLVIQVLLVEPIYKCKERRRREREIEEIKKEKLETEKEKAIHNKVE